VSAACEIERPDDRATDFEQVVCGYEMLLATLAKLPEDEYKMRMRHLCRSDLYVLIRYVFHRADIEHPWLYARCCEVQKAPDGFLDLWSRAHYKSTIHTYGKVIQDILIDPEITICIFSHTSPIAKAFLRQVKTELESNGLLKWLFDDILYENPRREAVKWSEDAGLIVKRKSNPKEGSLEASGLVDSMPTSRHYSLRVYDDVVTMDSVGSPGMLQKTLAAFQLSDNLGCTGGRVRIIGTRYHHGDVYAHIQKMNIATPRIYPCTVDGTEDGEPVLLPREVLKEKRKTQGGAVYFAQMLLDPRGGEHQVFERSWLCYYDGPPNPTGSNIYLLCDPASSKKPGGDWSAYVVVGLGEDGNYTILDLVRDHLDLGERWQMLLELHRKWRPLGVAYEQYGMLSDIDHFRSEMKRINYKFQITELKGKLAKEDRIKRLCPPMEQGKIWWPRSLRRTLTTGETINVVETTIEEELLPFPNAQHDDVIDCLSRVLDPNVKTIFPMSNDARQMRQNSYSLPTHANCGYQHMKRRRDRGARR